MNRTPIQGTTLVAAAGTPVPLVTRATPQTARSITFVGRKARATVNVGDVFVGTRSAQLYPITSDGSWVFSMPEHEKFDLSDIFVDATNSGDGVLWTAFV